jgi:hypothetical protein
LELLFAQKVAHSLGSVKTLYLHCHDANFQAKHVIELFECLHFSRTSPSITKLSICFTNDVNRYITDASGSSGVQFNSDINKRQATRNCKEALKPLLGTATVLKEGKKTTLIWKAKAGGVLVRRSPSQFALEPTRDAD